MDPLIVDSYKKNNQNNIPTQKNTEYQKTKETSSAIKHVVVPIQTRRPIKGSISKEMGIYTEFKTTDWFNEHFESIYIKTCEDVFTKAEYKMSILYGIASIYNQSIGSQKIIIPNNIETYFEIYTREVASKFIQFFLPKVSEDSIKKIIPDIYLGFISLMYVLEHCFHHRPLIEQASYSCPPPILQFLKKNIPKFETTKGIPLDRFENYTSPWANTIEDEEYVKKTCDEFEELIDDDLEVAKMVTFLVLFSPLQANLGLEESKELKQNQSKLTMIIYNHFLSKPDYDNMKALDRLNKLCHIIERLKKCGEILKTKNISPSGLDFQSDPHDLSSIQLYQM